LVIDGQIVAEARSVDEASRYARPADTCTLRLHSSAEADHCEV
jgi:hypothetical protein